MTNAELIEFLSKEDPAASVEMSVWEANGRGPVQSVETDVETGRIVINVRRLDRFLF